MAYNSSRYQYETSPRKVKPEYETPKRTYAKKSTAKKTESKREYKAKTKPISQAKVLLYVAIGFVALFVISYRYAVIDKTYSNLQGLKTELGTIQKETAQLEANIESSLKLTTIEEEAKEKLGMKKLTDDQIVWLTLPKTDYIESSSEEIKESKTNQNWFMIIINKIVETLTK